MNGKEIRTIFGQNIKNIRSRYNWSQGDLAENADISINFLGDIERGKKWPSPETLSKISKALEVDVHELFVTKKASVSHDNNTIIEKFLKDAALAYSKSFIQTANQTTKRLTKQYLSIKNKNPFKKPKK